LCVWAWTVKRAYAYRWKSFFRNLTETLFSFTLKLKNLLTDKCIFKALLAMNRYPIFTLKTGQKPDDGHQTQKIKLDCLNETWYNQI